MEYMDTKEAAEKWDCSQSNVAKWCREGKIVCTVKAEKINGRWRIPKNAECPKEKKKGG